jgi:hypothetical protein
MRKENIKTTLITCLIAACGGLFTVSLYTMGYVAGKEEGKHLEESVHYEAIQDCMADLEEGCPRLYDYALTLEKENARLNDEYSSCVRQLGDALGGQ